LDRKLGDDYDDDDNNNNNSPSSREVLWSEA
jgi:hypothetical protein